MVVAGNVAVFAQSAVLGLESVAPWVVHGVAVAVADGAGVVVVGVGIVAAVVAVAVGVAVAASEVGGLGVVVRWLAFSVVVERVVDVVGNLRLL